MFSDHEIRRDLLKKWSYNLRWASVPDDVIPLTAADPDFGSAQPIREALKRYASEGQFSYGPPEGLLSFRESLSKHYLTKRNLNAHPDHILPVDSAAFGIYLVCKTFLQPGDEAIIFDPVDFLFRQSVERVGAQAIPYSLPQGSSFDASKLETLVTGKTRMICLCNPLNPTGKVFSEEELNDLAKLADRHDLIILSDEIWSDIIFSPHRFTSIAALDPSIASRTITVTGFSKSYGLASLRIGALLCHDQLKYSKMFETSLHQTTIHGVNIPGQIAAQTALEECGKWLADFVLHLTQMRELTVTGLNAIPGFSCQPPEGCYVAFADIRNTGMSSEEVYALLLEQARVAVVPGLPKWFGQGAEGYIRISFATSKGVMQEALDRMRETVLQR